MKRARAMVLALILVCFLFSTAQATTYITFSELLETVGPATVHVIARTDEPNGMLRGDLTARTTWRWLIQDEDGEFKPSRLFVDMDKYEAMSLGSRSFVLNHKECDLTLSVSKDSGYRWINDISAVSRPLQWSDAGYIISLFAGGLLFAVLVYAFFKWKLPTSEEIEEAGGERNRGPGKLTIALGTWAIISEHEKNNRREQQEKSGGW